MANFTGPLLVDQSGASTGSSLNAADLNAFAVAQTFWMNPNTPSFSSMTLTFSSAPLCVVNTGSGGNASYVIGPASAVTITPGGSGAQDYYVFLLNTPAFSVLHVNAGTAFGVGSYPANGCLLCKATSNAGNTAIVSVSTALAPISPFPAGGMLIDASNSAAAVIFASGSTVTMSGLLTASAGASISSGLTVAGGESVTGGLTVSSGTSALQALTATSGTFSALLASSGGFAVTAGISSLKAAVPGTANNGLVNIASGPFDGSSAGHFVGSGAGTALAINAASGFAGNLFDAQLAGVSLANLNAGGDLTIGRDAVVTRNIIGGGDFTLANSHFINTQAVAPSIGFSSASATLASGSTDLSGVINLVTLSASSGATAQGAAQVLFQHAMVAAPRLVLVSICQSTGLNMSTSNPQTLLLVNNITASGFYVSFSGNTLSTGAIGVQIAYLVIH